MSYLKYDKGLGGVPETLDRVEICYTNSHLDKMKGNVIGWAYSRPSDGYCKTRL